MDKSKVEQMALAAQYWLDYQVLCGREILLAENFLSLPVGEFLGVSTTYTLKREWIHPKFKDAKQGRPRQIDYALFGRDKEHLKSAIEVKWVSNGQLDVQRYIDDLLRLECVMRNEAGQAVTRYFLVAGKKHQVKTKLLERTVNEAGKKRKPFARDFFPLVAEQENRVPVYDPSDVWKPYFKKFSDNYKIELPKSFKITLVADIEGHEIRVLAWRISCSQKRGTFDPSNW